MTDQLQKYCCNHEICGNELAEPKPFGTPNFCDTCQKANEQHAEQLRKAAEYDKLAEANRSLIADKAMLNDRIARLNETLELCDEQMKNSDNDYQYRITQLETHNEQLREQLEANYDLIRCGIGANYGGECYDRKLAEKMRLIDAVLAESPAASLADVQAQVIESVASKVYEGSIKVELPNDPIHYDWVDAEEWLLGQSRQIRQSAQESAQ